MASRIKIWVDDEILYAADLNAEFDNLLSQSVTPDSMDDCAEDALAMQTAADPYPGGSVSLPTSLRGEIHRLRYLIKQITGESYWYVDPDTTLADLYADLNALINLFDANTILAANTDNTPGAVTVGEDRIVGRIAGGNITALTLTQLLDMIGSCVEGDILYRDGTEWARLSRSTKGYFLKQGTSAPQWASDDGNKGDITISGTGATHTINNGVVTVNKIADGSVSVAKLAPPGAGNNYVASAAGGSTSATSYVKISQITCLRAGTLRVAFTLSRDGSVAYARVYKNGAPVSGEFFTAGSLLSCSADLTFAVGDLIQVYAKNSGGNTTTVGTVYIGINQWT